MSAPAVTDGRLVFTVDDPARDLVRVRLDCDDAIDGPRRFRRTATGWALAIPRPDLRRLEYRLVITDQRGQTEVLCDPGNPEVVGTASGERSVVLMPGYELPQWVRADVKPGVWTDVSFTDVIGELPIRVWAPDALAADTAAPLLIVHDGPEYDDLAELTRYGAVMVADGVLPAFRMALMQPVERDAWYSANPYYVRSELAAVADIDSAFARRGAPVVMGASLGGLCALLVACAGQPAFGGVFSQSGSYFTPERDEQESSYPFFDRITDAVAKVTASPLTRHPLVIGMTCGALEENYGNNVAMAHALAAKGHRVTLEAVPDLHNYTAWRDGLHPALTDVLRSAWGAPG
ncbi:MAG: alpha/beta hydrolase [Nocardioidaceae bacterium]